MRAKGIDNCVTFLNKIKSHLEDKNITIAVEYLNSKVNHKDYDFDHMAYGVEMCKRVNSPRVKILYDMYHVQIMEGDIIRMMRDNIQYISHFHTAGNPGRHEMDDTQEMNYRGIAKAIAATFPGLRLPRVFACARSVAIAGRNIEDIRRRLRCERLQRSCLCLRSQWRRPRRLTLTNLQAFDFIGLRGVGRPSG